ncbi:hypothetical protein L596_018031 [Steinernema carpocapsae]|uniref:Uncharacterized protein n=1 Tax=Steinernema carpocapsae TaxID=34508 RepID=A0A4U5N3F2_STECR|nr:hypothetical protein L596_018031 [Steinernema carpocapsae]
MRNTIRKLIPQDYGLFCKPFVRLWGTYDTVGRTVFAVDCNRYRLGWGSHTLMPFKDGRTSWCGWRGGLRP